MPHSEYMKIFCDVTIAQKKSEIKTLLVCGNFF